jgi:hypothetical protein
MRHHSSSSLVSAILLPLSAAFPQVHVDQQPLHLAPSPIHVAQLTHQIWLETLCRPRWMDMEVGTRTWGSCTAAANPAQGHKFWTACALGALLVGTSTMGQPVIHRDILLSSFINFHGFRTSLSSPKANIIGLILFLQLLLLPIATFRQLPMVSVAAPSAYVRCQMAHTGSS